MPWAIGIVLVVAAWGVALATPPEDAREEPFFVAAERGERAVGRNIAVTVHGVRRADSVQAEGWSAEGNWVVIDLDVEAVVSERGALLELATLDVAGRTFRASERPESLFKHSLSVGIPLTGSLAFELPEGVAGDAALSLGESSDTRLDSVITLHIDLDAIDVDGDAELVSTGWSAP